MSKTVEFQTEDSRGWQSQKGFTLVEMLISLVIFLIVTGAIYGLLKVGLNGRLMTNQQVELNKNIRVALNLVGRDTLNAGYGYPLEDLVKLPDNRISTLLAIASDADTTRDQVPPIVAGNNLTNASLLANSDQITFVFKDSTFNLVKKNPTDPPEKAVSQPLMIKKPELNGTIDVIVPITGSAAACRVNDIYLISGGNGSTLGVATNIASDKLQFANSDILNINQSNSSEGIQGITLPAGIVRVNLVTYFVTPDGTLTRREYANTNVAQGAAVPSPVGSLAAPRDEALLYGVEGFQIKYVMNDGVVLDDPGISILPQVRQIRFSVTVRSAQNTVSGQPYRISMTSTFSTRNLSYEID